MRFVIRRIAVPLLGPLFAGVLLLTGCSVPGGSSGGGDTITGSVSDTLGSHPVVGLFDAATYWFQNNSSTTPDQVTAEADGAPTPYTPVQIATVSGGSFSMTLPAGTSGSAYYLIAWDDAAGTGKITSLTSENCYFAVKSFPQGSSPVREISYVSYNGQGEYAADYYLSGTNYIEGFSQVGTTGYDFSIR